MTLGCTDLDGYKVFSFDKVSSTQTLAHEMVARGVAQDRIAIVAKSQTAGRGRYRRNWVSKNGNLYVSFIYDCAVPDSRLAYAIAVAVAETLVQVGVRPTIKWPNDILIDGKKVCGVLIEYAAPFVIVGIGINVAVAPRLKEYQTTKVNDYCTTTVAEVFQKLVRNIDLWRGADFADVRARWMDLAAGLWRMVRYRGESAQLIGIDENGALVLRRDGTDFLAWGGEIRF